MEPSSWRGADRAGLSKRSNWVLARRSIRCAANTTPRNPPRLTPTPFLNPSFFFTMNPESLSTPEPATDAEVRAVAWALGQLDPAEAAAFEREMAASPALAAYAAMRQEGATA